MMDPVTFAGKLNLIVGSYPFYGNTGAELQAIVAALNPDPTTCDATIQTAPRGLRPGVNGQTPFVNEVLLLINRGKAGNLANTVMADLIDNELSTILPPVNTSAPLATGTTTLSVTTGIWQNSPTSYTYQWLRGGANIAGATAATYVTVGADAGTNVSCRVTAHNPAGSANSTSNAIAVA
jgi:hypothetical protein